ncbi:unnamed protein product [Hermetia illucens]|uniref:Calponin-homology (CH) domain-containing protein n=1 Tax=Hermetia illucens TaxID=343691 RepID=A0A7R8UE08_HERIL|nr:unnamed protein product [Hermetia illucens]
MAVLAQRAHQMNGGQCQLTRSLERILEEAHFSGELKLSNRKLKDFPKSATKFNLSDTVIADLSRNRFCELPEDITSFAFLETLLLYHNTIRSISQSIKGLSSLTYLDLRSNHLTSLPREICFLPIQVLLVANNRLTTLPDELGRMEKLTDLDASCNQLTSLPMRIGDLRNLRSLSLRSNQLVYLPREITYLLLVSLNLSSNKITSLPAELRQMTTLVELNLENNPLTSPPASLCVRGLVHVFKYLDIQAMKEDKVKSGTGYDGLTTLRRTPRHTNSLTDASKTRRANIDSGYSTSDGVDKRWSQDAIRTVPVKNMTPKPKPSKLVDSTLADTINSTTPIQGIKNGPNDLVVENNSNEQQLLGKNDSSSLSNAGSSNSESTSPEDDYSPDNQKQSERNKNFGNIQTYREYKEALKQQRNQELSIYRPKGQNNTNDMNRLDGNIISNDIDNLDDHNNSNINSSYNIQTNGQVKKSSPDEPTIQTVAITTKKPVQKVIPSRSTTPLYQAKDTTAKDAADYTGYVKPSSPTKCNGSTPNNNSSLVGSKLPTTTKISNIKPPLTKPSRNVSWNSDIPPEKLSFTMRREFDKQKEETELLTQLRTIIETRLKMNMPEDIASALTDGVVLCHLANYVRPRSVGSIHVPSPGVPKLTMARCRRNVDNFLEACRRIGVDEESICSCADVVCNESDTDDGQGTTLPNPSAVYRTIKGLLDFHQVQQQLHQQQQQQLKKEESINFATNANNRTDEYGLGHANDESIRSESTLYSNPRDYMQDKSNGNLHEGVFFTSSSGSFEQNQIEKNWYLYNNGSTKELNFYLNNIEEEAEYEEEVVNEGRDNCKINGFDSSSYSYCNELNSKDFKYDIAEVNNLNITKQPRAGEMTAFGKESNMMCCAADVLEGKGAVQVAITVGELFRFHKTNSSGTIKSPTRNPRSNSQGQSLSPSPTIA